MGVGVNNLVKQLFDKEDDDGKVFMVVDLKLSELNYGHKVTHAKTRHRN